MTLGKILFIVGFLLIVVGVIILITSFLSKNKLKITTIGLSFILSSMIFFISGTFALCTGL